MLFSTRKIIFIEFEIIDYKFKHKRRKYRHASKMLVRRYWKVFFKRVLIVRLSDYIKTGFPSVSPYIIIFYPHYITHVCYQFRAREFIGAELVKPVLTRKGDFIDGVENGIYNWNYTICIRFPSNESIFHTRIKRFRIFTGFVF